MSDLRVLVVADNLLTRAGLASLLATQAGCDVVGQISGALLPDEVDLYRPEALVYDLGWDSVPSLSRLTTLMDSEVDVPVVALLNDENTASAVAATLRGEARTYGLLLRETEPGVILAALNAVVNGMIVLDPALAAAAFSMPPANATQAEPTQTEDLTPREREVLQLLAQGLPNKLIAQRLDISDHTVKFHVNAIMTKLGAQSRTEAVVRATRSGLVIL